MVSKNKSVNINSNNENYKVNLIDPTSIKKTEKSIYLSSLDHIQNVQNDDLNMVQIENNNINTQSKVLVTDIINKKLI